MPSPPVSSAGRHEQDEDRPDAVIAESLPELGKEEGRETSGVPEERRVLGCVRDCRVYRHTGPALLCGFMLCAKAVPGIGRRSATNIPLSTAMSKYFGGLRRPQAEPQVRSSASIFAASTKSLSVKPSILCGPDLDAHASPAEMDLGVMILLLGQSAQAVRETQGRREIGKPVGLLEMVVIDGAPAPAEPVHQS